MTNRNLAHRLYGRSSEKLTDAQRQLFGLTGDEPAAPLSAAGRALIKAALTGGLIGVEYLLARRNPNSRIHRAFAMINFGAAGIVAGTAMHNYTIARPR